MVSILHLGPMGPRGATGACPPRNRRGSAGPPPDAPTASWTPCDRAAARRRPRGGDGNGEVQQKRATKTGLGLVRCGETMKQKKHEQLGILGKLYIYIYMKVRHDFLFFIQCGLDSVQIWGKYKKTTRSLGDMIKRWKSMKNWGYGETMKQKTHEQLGIWGNCMKFRHEFTYVQYMKTPDFSQR